MRHHLIFLGLTCLLLAGCSEQNDPITLDKDTLPLKSKIVIEGHYGCEFGMPYVLIINQKKSKVTISLDGYKDNFDKQPVSIDNFKALWAAFCQGNVAELKESYGEIKTTADFRGTFSISVKTNKGKLAKKTNLTYGIIEDDLFNEIINKIMEMLSPEHHLPEYSITSIDYSKLPLASRFSIFRQDSNKEPSLSAFRVMQEGRSCHYSTYTAVQSEHYDVDTEKYKEFWRQCSELDLVSLRDLTNTTNNQNEPKDYCDIEIFTIEGKYSIDIAIDHQNPKHERFYQMIMELAEEKPWAD